MSGVPEPQPAKAVLALRRISNRSVARQLGCSEAWVGRVVNGLAPPSARFRRELAALLTLPEELLFRPGDKQAAKYPGDTTLRGVR